MYTVIPSSVRPFVYVLLIVNVSARAQTRRTRERYFTAGFNTGIMGGAFSKTISGQGNSLSRDVGILFSQDGRNRTIPKFNSSLGINAGFLWKDRNSKNFTAIQAELQHNRLTYVFNNPCSYTITPMQQDGDSDDTGHVVTYGRWAENDTYFKYSLSLQRFWYWKENSVMKGDSYFYLKESFGQSFWHRNMGNAISLQDDEHITYDHGYTLNARTTSYNPTSYVLGTEVGIRSFSIDKDRALDVGVVLTTPFSQTYTRQYNIYQNKTETGKSEVAYGGASIMMNVTYTFNQELKEKKISEEKLEREKIDQFAKAHTESGRNFEVQQKVDVNADLVNIKVWDRGTVDGDVITLYLNGEDILDNYTTSKSRKEITLHLKQGPNYLVMYAVNLGKIPPNTASIEIEKGSQRKSVTVNSDMNKSGAIELIYKP
jgi:hypothetical protein